MDLNLLLDNARAFILNGNERGLRLLLDGSARKFCEKLILCKLNGDITLRRPSSSNEFIVKQPNLLLLAITGWFTDITDLLCSYGVGIEEAADVWDPTNAHPVYYESKPLILASMLGKVDMVKSLVEYGANIEASNSIGETSLLEACYEGNFAVTEFLVQKRASLNRQNEKGLTGLMLAAYAGNTDIVDLLLRKGANAHIEDVKGRNALFYCVSAGHLTLFRQLLAHGVQIESDMDGMTLLMEAAYGGHMDTVRYLAVNSNSLRINIHQLDKSRRNALFYAFDNSQLAVAAYLVSEGAVLELVDHNKNLLMCACLKNNLLVVEYLLEHLPQLSLELDHVDDKGRNVLFYAVTGGSSHILQTLLNSGAAVQSSPDGITLLMQAAGKRQLEVGRCLLANRDKIKVDINSVDKDGWSALLYSVSAQNLEFCKMLILEGAKAIKAADGKTEAMQAAQNGDIECLKYLVDKSAMIGLDLQSTDSIGWNCLYYAMVSESIPCVTYITSCGVKASCNQHGTTLLMESVDRGQTDMTRYLVENAASIGLDINARDESGCNALFYCSANGSRELFEYLVNNEVRLCDDLHNRTVLMQAAYNVHKSLVLYLIDNELSLSLDVNQKDQDGRNVLFYCIEGGNLDLLVSLLEFGIPMQTDNSGKNNLFQAVSAGHAHIVEYILKNSNLHLKLDPLATDSNGNNAMYYYAKRPNNKHILSQLLSAGLKLSDCSNASNILAQALKEGDLNTAKLITSSFDNSNVEQVKVILRDWRSDKGESLFHWVAVKNDEEFCRLLAPYYDPVADRDDHNRTPLISAAAQRESDGNADVVKCMLEEAKMNVNAMDIHKHTALWYAVCSENNKALQLLLQHGACNVLDNYNSTILMTSAKVGNIMATQYLLNLLPDSNQVLNQVDQFKRNVLHYAAMSGSSEVASLYCRWNSKLLDEVDDNGCTPLMIAAAWGHTQTVANLIKHGANVSLTDTRLRTCLHYCVDQASPSLTTIHILCTKANADIDAKDQKGQTPLMIAARRGQLVVAKCLLAHSADPIVCDYEALEAVDYCKRGDYRMKRLISRFSSMPYLERCCIETKRVEYREVLDVTRILHMLQKKHIITPQLEAIVLADPGFTGRVDRLLDILMSRGPQAFDVFAEALKSYYPVLGHELLKLHYLRRQTEIKG